MKRAFIFIIVILFVTTCILPAPVYSKDKVLLSTLDVSREYEIIGIVYGRVSSNDMKELNMELERRALKMDADAVIGVRYLPYVGYLYAYGTAVKFKE